MKNINCKHCQLSCKTQGKTECDNYNAKANRPEQLKEKIRQEFNRGNYDTAKELQNELFRINHG